MIQVEPLEIPDVLKVRSPVFPDARGDLIESWTDAAFETAGVSADFVQDLFSHNVAAGTVRGLHFQGPPHPQAKLVRVVSGRVFDVAVDMRASSATYGQAVTLELESGTGIAVFIPAGFAHGFCTLRDDTTVHYKISGAYSPDCAAGVRWNDPALGIEWPVPPHAATLSDSDRALPDLAAVATAFA